MRELFNKALQEKLSPAKYAVNEIQKQVFVIEIIEVAQHKIVSLMMFPWNFSLSYNAAVT